MRELISFLLCGAVFVAIFTIVKRGLMRRRAKRLLVRHKALYSGNLEYTDVSPRDFPWVDHSFYDDISMKMTRAGFWFVADTEPLTATKQYPGMRTFLRCFIGDSGTTMAAAYHIKMRGSMGLLALVGVVPKNMHVVDFNTEFTDGTFLITNNCLGLNRLSDIPRITNNQLDPGASFDSVLSCHRNELQKITAERNKEVVRITTKEDLVASQDRLHTLKCEHRARQGYVTREDFERIARKPLSHAQRKFVAEVERIRDSETNRD